jgi:hypothetical protein
MALTKAIGVMARAGLRNEGDDMAAADRSWRNLQPLWRQLRRIEA